MGLQGVNQVMPGILQGVVSGDPGMGHHGGRWRQRHKKGSCFNQVSFHFQISSGCQDS
jgi:hypothetical protein